MPDLNATPYRFGPDSAGAEMDGPAGGENVLPADPNDPTPQDLASSPAAWQTAVIVLLTEIRDALLSADGP
jgi:hypothetical protein